MFWGILRDHVEGEERKLKAAASAGVEMHSCFLEIATAGDLIDQH